MKKPLIYLLTAGLALSTFTSTYTVSATEEGEVTTSESKTSDATIKFNGDGLSLEDLGIINFSNNQLIESSNSEISATDKIVTKVSDLRGTGQGWKLTAAISDFSLNDEPTVSSLNGAIISFKGGEKVSANVDSQAVELTPPDVVENIEFKTSEPYELVTASAKGDQQYHLTEGLGAWNMSWAPSISVPGAVASEDNHKATITWTIHNTPDITEL